MNSHRLHQREKLPSCLYSPCKPNSPISALKYSTHIRLLKTLKWIEWFRNMSDTTVKWFSKIKLRLTKPKSRFKKVVMTKKAGSIFRITFHLIWSTLITITKVQCLQAGVILMPCTTHLKKLEEVVCSKANLTIISVRSDIQHRMWEKIYWLQTLCRAIYLYQNQYQKSTNREGLEQVFKLQVKSFYQQLLLKVLKLRSWNRVITF